MIAQTMGRGPAGVSPHAVALILAAEVGVLLALAAWWRLHALAALLSVPVLHGFETGAALAIGLSQLPVLLGSTARGSSLPQLLSSWQDTSIDPRRELAGLSAANFAAAATGGMPVAGSFTRSVMALDAGSRTRMAGVFTAVMMGLALLVIGRPLAMLPTAVLAATIVIASLAVFDLQPFREAWRYDRAECVLMIVVAGLTVVVGVAWALGVGVAASIGLLLQRTARPHVALVGRVPGTEHYRNAERYDVELTPAVMALRIDESLLFTNARQLSDVVAQQLATYPDTRRVVLQMSPVNHIDLSGLAALRALHDMLAGRHIRLDLSEVKGPVLDALQAGDWKRWFSGELFLSHHHAMQAVAGVTPRRPAA